MALALSVKQKDSRAVAVKVYPYLWAHLTNDSAVLQLKGRGAGAQLWNPQGTNSAFCFSILESRAISERLSSCILPDVFEGVFQADLGGENKVVV